MLQTRRVDCPEGEGRIREAFHYAASGMAIADLDGKFQLSNPAYASIVGRTEQELRQESILSITHDEDRDACQERITELLSGDISSFLIEKRYLRPTGEAIWVRNSFSLLKDEGEYATHIILVCNDISERRRAERLLVERERLATVGQLASSIAHEINNPLEAVLNLLFLAKGAKTLKQARGFAVQAETEVEHIAQIATQTLRFRKEQARPVLTGVAELLDSVLLLYKGKLSEAHVRVHVTKRDSPELVCYPGEIRQVFANLMRNAIDAMPTGGDLHIRVRPGTDWRTGPPGARITVADTGHGMSEETRSRIYEPFFTTKGNVGTGLGLWVTSSILTKHHGHLHVRSSTQPGKSWTAFTLVLPRSGAEGEKAGLGEI